MPIRHRKKIKRLPLNAPEREGVAAARALAWRPRVHSRQRARRRSKGENYNFRGTRGDKSISRVKVRKIESFERWQFGSDAPQIDGKTIVIRDAWRYYVPPEIYDNRKKIAEKLANEKSFTEIMRQLSAKHNRPIAGNIDKFLEDIL